ncbi:MULTISPECIES: pyridoxal 5'-phosphate synthase [unclassified Streptomyces]|uniref:pyridoxine/pyridoxamine 5'-phosphate oxidase n=1 Tax=unclassified Streptomyces TaxID=2593676 RepID=UPI00382043F3
MSEDPSTAQEAFRRLLHRQRVWDLPSLPSFDPGAAPEEPLSLFLRWFAEAAAAGQPEPHTMSLATVDEVGLPDVRTLMLHGADGEGWHFASHATSTKGRQLAAHPRAALGFYWATQARQVRVRGSVTAGTAEEGQADLHARSTGALAAALTGRQSEPLGSQAELVAESEAAWVRAQEEPDAPVPTWTAYCLAPEEVEFFQGDTHRRHVRLRYRLGGNGEWDRELLWP